MKEAKQALLLAFLGALAAFYIFSFPLQITHDGGVYISGARSLAEGKGFQNTGVKGESFQVAEWMPGYAAAIAAFHFLTGASFISSSKQVNLAACFFSLFFWLLFFLLTIRKKSLSLSACFIFLVSPGLWNFLGVALSEGLFMALLGLAAVCVHFRSQAAANITRVLWTLLLSLSMLTACFTRYAGIALAAGTLIYLLSGFFSAAKKQALCDSALFSSVFIAGLLPWLMRIHFVAGNYSFIHPIHPRALSRFSPEAAIHFLSILGGRFFNLPERFGWAAAGVVLLAALLLLLGAMLLKNSKTYRVFPKSGVWLLSAILCYVPLLFYMVLVFSESPPRYYWVLTPFALGLFASMADAFDSKETFAPRFVLYGMLSLLCLTGLTGMVQSGREISSIAQRKADFNTGFVFYPRVFGASREPVLYLKNNLTREDLLFSNYSKFVPMLWDGAQPCYQADPDLRKQLSEWPGVYRRVYILLAKSNFHYKNRPLWNASLAGLETRTLFEDRDTLLAELVSNP